MYQGPRVKGERTAFIRRIRIGSRVMSMRGPMRAVAPGRSVWVSNVMWWEVVEGAEC